MFATLRAEDRDGEVVCISSTNQLPQSGQNQNHFACDRCRIKKLKCTGHRFGCQRCRDRNLSCTYSTTSQSRQRKAEKQSTPQRIASHNSSTPSGSEEFLIVPHSPREALRGSPSRQPQGQTGLGATEHDHPLIQTHLVLGGQVQVSSPAQHLKNSALAAATRPRGESPAGSPEIHELTLPDYIEPCLPDFDMEDLLQTEMPLSEDENERFMLDNTFASSTSPEDEAGSHEGTFNLARSNTSSDDMNWNSYQHSKRKLDSAREYARQESAKRPTSKTSSQDRISTAASTPYLRTIGGNSEFATSPDIQQGGPIPVVRRGTHYKYASHCRCVSVTLSLLEKIQGHRKSTSVFTAEKALHSLKGSISQCQALSSCRSCPSPSRVMTFSVLLVEKMAGMLEDMASMWETTLIPSSEGKAAPGDADGHARGWAPIHLGQYRIDSAQEWHEVFGFLVLLQVRRLSSFLDRLRRNAAREGWESQQSALGSVILRIEELQEALGGMTLGFGR